MSSVEIQILLSLNDTESPPSFSRFNFVKWIIKKKNFIYFCVEFSRSISLIHVNSIMIKRFNLFLKSKKVCLNLEDNLEKFGKTTANCIRRIIFGGGVWKSLCLLCLCLSISTFSNWFSHAKKLVKSKWFIHQSIHLIEIYRLVFTFYLKNSWKSVPLFVV